MRRSVFLTGVILMSSIGATLGRDGAIPIWQPTVITQSGKYVVTRNIVTAAADPVLTITGSNVQVDLNGFTLSHTGASPVVLAQNATGVVLENGSVVQGGSADGIRFSNVREFLIRRLTVSKTGFNEAGINLLGSEVGTVEDNLVDGSFELSLWISTGRGIQVRHNVFRNTDCEAGVAFDSTSDCTLADNLMLGCSSIRVSGNGNRIVGNDIRTASGSPGLRVSGSRNRIENNTFIDNPNGGLSLAGSGNFYSRNLSRGNQGGVCGNPAGTADFCDEGTNNTSAVDNYMPGKL